MVALPGSTAANISCAEAAADSGNLLSVRWLAPLCQAYLVCLPTTRGLWKHAADNIPTCGTDQEVTNVQIAINCTVQHPLAMCFPRDINHALETLLWLQNTFTKKGYKNSKLLEIQIQKIKDELNISTASELTYKTYIINTEDCDFLDEHYLSTVSSSRASLSETVATSLTGRGHITLLEAVDGIARGTTGLTSWGGGAVMAEWLDNNKQLLEGRRVLELGSGVGYMAAAVLSKCGQRDQRSNQMVNGSSEVDVNGSSEVDVNGSSEVDVNGSAEADVNGGPLTYTATDCHPHVLELLFHNLSLMEHNKVLPSTALHQHQSLMCKRLAAEELPAGERPDQPWCAPRECLSVRGVPTKVVCLDWREPNLPLVCDVIIAADIVYASHLLPALAKLLRCLLTEESEFVGATTQNTTAVELNTSETNTPAATSQTTTNTPAAGAVTNTVSQARAAYIACTRRNNDTITEFLSALTIESLSYSLVYQATLDAESALFVYNESHVPVKIFKIILA